jgi:hypothetical protein
MALINNHQIQFSMLSKGIHMLSNHVRRGNVNQISLELIHFDQLDPLFMFLVQNVDLKRQVRCPTLDLGLPILHQSCRCNDNCLIESLGKTKCSQKYRDLSVVRVKNE